MKKNYRTPCATLGQVTTREEIPVNIKESQIPSLGSVEDDETHRKTHAGALENERSERFTNFENDLPRKLEMTHP